MSVLRCLRTLTSSSGRTSLCVSSSTRRSLATFVHGANHRSVNAFAVAGTRGFKVSACARGEGATDIALVSKLKEEIKYEKETAAEVGEPEFIKEFESHGTWKIHESPGQDEVTLTRTFGNESSVSLPLPLPFAIRLSLPFPIAIAIAIAIAIPTLPFPFLVPSPICPSHKKPEGGGALTFDTLLQEGAFVVDTIPYYSDSALGTDLTAEADWKRRGLYIGPRYDQLDTGVQEEFEKYLEERGIGEGLAMFIPEYAESASRSASPRCSRRKIGSAPTGFPGG
ncbi:mitochondrial glyco protein [Rickenella mellea]|uniref:Mitochondrial glyco protein n=1 Tax=Rickenella mellea TaxID=50990 RepID=A0A4Y7Q633_9AGAM|nr:mitochondrial glyco protein [Rickenella mellea]